MRFIPAFVVVAVITGTTAGAQTVPDFASLDVMPGERLFVTRPDGVEVGGPVVRLDRSALVIDGFEFHPEPGLKIERDGDSIWNGALYGAGIGGFLGTTVALEGCIGRSAWPCFVMPALEFGAIGAFIDWRVKGRTTIYGPSRHRRRAALVPSVTPTQKALGVRLAF